ncbi:GreA/GreB family elongation factor [Sphingosinicella rhizophila]|uniref:GreA/GreB family elongation factor n=1 Tax=Sphingosinicella rhizophila TaxID=3050082 RepID=A0ABU3Q9L9_9SPHN|nr:GreA/GreB family elongation factor [Sphingosinicella sp. GR2756]MDT9600101.1 GreA/GreB family elongation factor [Sphingosinicella sp. GR2756]
MSVAFRRESDEEHLEPKFEIPIPPGPNLVTAKGLAQIAARVAALEAAVATETEETRLAEAKRDLRYWRTRHATAELAPPPPADEVAFGSRVRFRLKGDERMIHIVGDDEADPAEGRIAFSAPLARAMMGAGPGDFADFAGTEDAIEILAIGDDA